MIKVENGTVQIVCPKEDLKLLVLTADLTPKDASQVIVGADIAMIFQALVDRYSLDEAATLWTTAIEAYKDLVLLKGDPSHDDN